MNLLSDRQGVDTASRAKLQVLFSWQYEALRRFQKTVLPDGTVRRFFGAFFGTGAGKSTFGAIWALDQHIRTAQRLAQSGETRGPLGLIVAPTYRHLDRHAVGSLLSIVHGTIYQGRYVSNRSEYYPPAQAGGGRVYCGSADNPTSLEGAHVDYVWVDEGGLTKDLLWAIVQARTQIRQAPILVTSYWYSLQWCYRELWQPWELGNMAIDIMTGPSTVNPNIDPAEFERLRRTMDSRLFSMRHEGRPAKMVGLVYGEAWDERDPVLHCEPFAIPPDWPVFAGCDQGYAPDPFHLVLLAEDPSGVLYAFAEYRANAKLSHENAEAVNRLARSLGVAGQFKRIWCDPANKQGLHDFRYWLRRGSADLTGLDCAVNPADNTVDSGIEKLVELFRLKKLRIMRGRCPALVQELGLYHRDDDGVIVKADDHGPDALRYGVYNWALRSRPLIV